MTYDEFRRHVQKAGITLTAFAELVRMNRVSLSNYAKQAEVPGHLAIIAVLMGELAENGINFQPALQKLDIAAKRPRGAAKQKFGGDPQCALSLESVEP